jgi:hypothetical protein
MAASQGLAGVMVPPIVNADLLYRRSAKSQRSGAHRALPGAGRREVYVTPGNREDIVAGKTIKVWGSERDGVLVAETVCVITANGR